MLNNKGACLPFHHQFLLAQLADDILSDDSRYWNNFSGYTFSGLKGQTKVSKLGLHYYSSRVTLVLSSSNSEFIDVFIARLFEQKNIKLGELELTPETVEKEISAQIQQEQISYVAISPMVVVHPSVNSLSAKKFISPETDVFSDLLYETVMNRMEHSGMFTSEEIASFYKFQLVPDKSYLQKTKESDKKFARIYPVFYEHEQRLEVRGYTFPFTLFAAPAVHQYIFECGIGSLTEKGFGMLDIVGADITRQTVPYVTSSDKTLVVINRQHNGYHGNNGKL